MATTDETPLATVTDRAFVCNYKGEFLLLQRNQEQLCHPGMWELPGGRIDHGDAWSEALTREIQKGTGLQVRLVKDLVFCDSVTIGGGDDQGRQHAVRFSLAHLVGGKLQISRQYQSSFWVTASQALRLFKLTPEVRQAITAAEHRLF